MNTNVLWVPVRIGLRVTRIGLGVSLKIAGRIAGGVAGVVWTPPDGGAAGPAPGSRKTGSAGGDDPAATRTRPDASAGAVEQTGEGVGAAGDGRGGADDGGRGAPDSFEAGGARSPLTPQQAAVKTIDDEDELVAEVAEPGAEDGAGAEVHLPEPWHGYGSAGAEAIIARLSEADAAQLAVVELFERAHRNRAGVLDAAATRLAELADTTAD
ncbi:hypothetical protein [Conexibacter sp. DBS9H8]|uniref:hypothetical protein n=1 Tax=Conexibacter sp. DBS9H8 TaxID=2937801 RepID=UPI00200E8BCC|nr:hypothetical protein [Conexibacter sp. DBS9H8]